MQDMLWYICAGKWVSVCENAIFSIIIYLWGGIYLKLLALNM